MNQNQELTIQRLIDGELTHRERSDFLSSIDRHPDIWRELALAFVEDQVWDDFSRQSIAELSAHPPRYENESKMADLGISAVNGKQQNFDSQIRPSKPTSWLNKYGPRLMLTAAATMLALTIAIRFDAGWTGFQKNQVLDTAQEIDRLPNQRGRDTRLASDEPYMFQLGDNEPVPLYSEFDQMTDSISRSPIQITPELQKQFFDAGYQLQRFISGQDSNGRSFIVPIHGLRIQSYVQ